MTPPHQDQLITVLVPMFNAERTIVETLQSARAQTYVNIEIVIVDDGSTDQSFEIVEALARDDARLRLFRQDNSGVARARNHGLDRARGGLIAPLDADDVWHPTKLKRQIARLAADGDAGLAYCFSYDIDERSIVVDRRLAEGAFEGWVTAPLIVTNFLGNSSSPLILKQCIEAVDGWDASLHQQGAQGCEDWRLYLALSRKTRFVNEPAFLVGYRQTANAMSRDIEQMRKSHRLVLNWCKSQFPTLFSRLAHWSISEFEHYAAEMHRADGRHWQAITTDLSAAVDDPRWLLNRSSWRRLTSGLQRTSLAGGFPSGLPFAEAPTDCMFRPALPRSSRHQRAVLEALVAGKFPVTD